MAEEKEEKKQVEISSVSDFKKIIAGINPDLYFSGNRAKFKKLVKEIGISKAFKKMKDEDADPESLITFELGYDAPTSQIEPIYFWLLDFMEETLSAMVEKITDNFTSSPGSGHFAEIGARSTRMQEEGMKILGAINQVTKSVLNLIYDLKEFELRLKHYEDANSKDKKIKEAGMLSLKQIWMDNVDMKKGRGSINQMSMELGFTTLRDAFMIADSVEDVRKMASGEGSINDQVKRILIPRLSEFLKWKELSQKELQKRFEIEKSYLHSQVETIKLYSSWARPYLKAAEKLRQKGFETSPALVNAFNTVMFELVLFGKSKFNLKNAIESKSFPEGFENYHEKRKYYSCYLVALTFRGIPQKVTQQHYGFGGKVSITFDCYVLNEDEINMIKKEMKEQDVEDTAKIFQESTEESLEQLKDDLDHFLGEKEKKEIKSTSPQNPFSALFSFIKPSKSSSTSSAEIQIRKDNFIEKAIRSEASISAKKSLYLIYDIYKKAHGMESTFDDFSLGSPIKNPAPTFFELIKSLFSR